MAGNPRPSLVCAEPIGAVRMADLVTLADLASVPLQHVVGFFAVLRRFQSAFFLVAHSALPLFRLPAEPPGRRLRCSSWRGVIRLGEWRQAERHVSRSPAGFSGGKAAVRGLASGAPGLAPVYALRHAFYQPPFLSHFPCSDRRLDATVLTYANAFRPRSSRRVTELIDG